MGNASEEKGDAASTGRDSYAGFADRYAAAATDKPHDALYERPATLALLGDVAGLNILDAGCGPGVCSEHLARAGATVHAFDVTPQMVRLAQNRCAGLSVETIVDDLMAPMNWLPDNAFDKVLCSLAFDYPIDILPALAEFRRVARPDATLVFSMAHPMRDWMDERTHGGASYFKTTRFGLHWSGFGEPRPYVEALRRPLSDILNVLTETGWFLDRIVEPRPLPEMNAVAARHYAELSSALAFICIRARRHGGPYDERNGARD